MRELRAVVTLVMVVMAASSSCGGTRVVCPRCGGMEVPYPLSTQDGCGEPNYRIHCNDNEEKGSLELQFKSQVEYYYKILHIDVTRSRMVIETPEIRSDACYSSDLKQGGLKLDDGLPFNISSRNTVMLFNCSDSILLSPLNCSGASPCRLFERAVPEGRGCANSLCCSFLKDASITAHRIKVRLGGCTAYTSVVDLRRSDSPETWMYGVELQWS
ncbi:hypothetical protein H6P81_004026 [Aristolochia fimbriata]|uniref:Wall-associated receptor kinase galacturonan-binding domain-containing protein n=1 Tax=Aristolochia fimbriata TaxID=158543 RepID=A0AAV7FEF1_ARIFI|nr:hypothetical protein H6P81_004026 [Aristolochia fimbriata]